MSTLNVTLPEDLLIQLVMLAAHDGMSLNQYVATAVAEKVATSESSPGIHSFGHGRCAQSNAHTLTIVQASEAGVIMHDHLLPYHCA